MNETEKFKSIRLVIKSELENVFFVGIMIQSLCRFLELESNACGNMQLSVVEAVNNAIIHAYNGKPGHDVEIEIQVSDERLVFKVCDKGKAMDGQAKPLPSDYDSGKRDALPEGKMGLFIIDSCMDEVDYSSTDETNTLTLTKYLHNAHP